MNESRVEPVNLEDLEKALVTVPGEGKRLLICLFATEHDAGADGVTIVAMAETREELLQAMLEEGMYVRRAPLD